MVHPHNVRRAPLPVSDGPERHGVAPLEPEEKVAGRLFRDLAQLDLDALNVEQRPHYTVPPVIPSYRHQCDQREFLSTSLELREVYVASPRLVVETDEQGVSVAYVYAEHRPNRDMDSWQMPAGRFGYIYREGRCRHCGRIARSNVGRIVDAWQRPPITGALVR